MQSWQAQPHLRQKKAIDVNLSDRELFNSVELGDTWEDAKLPDVYRYLRKSAKCKIPDSWLSVFQELDAQLEA